MKELVATFWLTQNEKLPIKDRIFVKKVFTSNPDAYREATEAEYDQYLLLKEQENVSE